MKPCDYLLLFTSILTITYADFCFVVMNLDQIVQLVCFNVLVFMAMWSLLATFLTDPGFIPMHYRYDDANINETDLALKKAILAKQG